MFRNLHTFYKGTATVRKLFISIIQIIHTSQNHRCQHDCHQTDPHFSSSFIHIKSPKPFQRILLLSLVFRFFHIIYVGKGSISFYNAPSNLFRYSSLLIKYFIILTSKHKLLTYLDYMLL